MQSVEGIPPKTTLALSASILEIIVKLLFFLCVSHYNFRSTLKRDDFNASVTFYQGKLVIIDTIAMQLKCITICVQT
jgi:hypothetical protein